MELKFSKINGTNADLNYDLLKASIINKLAPTCNEAEVIILNSFPVAVSAQVTIGFILLLNIPRKNNSYYRVSTSIDRHYVRNQIIAVSIVNDYQDSSINFNNGLIEIDGAYADFEDNASKIKWGLTNYLSNNCGLDRRYITVHPLTWIKNSSCSIETNNILIGNQFTYDKIEEVIKLNNYFKWSGYKDWYSNESQFESHIKNIFEQASKDSIDGYITKKKIDRIQNKLDEASTKAYENIGKKLVEVKGKAGTGKSSDILKWMLKSSLEGKKGVFLTYNHVLVYDISSQIQRFINRLSNNDQSKKLPTTTYTIHSYFYNLAKKLGVLLLMSEKRINELTSTLDNRWVSIENYLNKTRNLEQNISLQKLLMYVQNSRDLSTGVKKEIILFIHYIEHLKFLPNQKITNDLFKGYRKSKIDKLANLASSNIFLKDYHKVLERILQATLNLDLFISDLDVVSKFDLLSGIMNLNENILQKDGSGKINLEKLKTRYKKSISGFRAGRIAYIDEAQDCHPLERDILFSIFGSHNVVIANGDKEQLIRYTKLCNWHISRGHKIDFYKYQKKRKSYRMKPAIAALANHIAEHYDIDLNIEPLDTEDHGTIFIDYNFTIENQVEVVKHLKTIGGRQGCTNYESLLLLNTSESLKSSEGGNQITTSVSVNEHDNIVSDKSNVRSEWQLIKEANSKLTDATFWNITGNVEKRELSVPGSLSIRSMYYESCRGIEAWSIMCFQLDDFFEHKKQQDNADNYLLEDLFDQLTPEKRREKYAATWVLMAITRGMENCYINLKNKDSNLSKVISRFATTYPQYTNLIG
ncbi:AAA family ATPase [uncultured Polaribacter sp.]|uniref:AAA family ATPase n=1 Tax=uncultured Polaribacter sp. TaxID=174711 RepID=UPI00259BE33C|nr:AAA family ATPase [uncultured Polaribacter sp.]